MITLPDGISRDDIHQWLGGGVCLARSAGTWQPAIYDRMVSHPDTGAELAQVRLLASGFMLRVNVTRADLAGSWPLCGSINLPSLRVATHVERQPARQYRRTFNSRQVRIRLPRAWEVAKLLGARVNEARQCSNVLIGAVFNPWYPPDVDSAFDLLADGWLSVAINPRIIVAGDPVGKRMIYYRGELAASTSQGRLDPIASLSTCRIINRALKGRLEWTIGL